MRLKLNETSVENQIDHQFCHFYGSSTAIQIPPTVRPVRQSGPDHRMDAMYRQLLFGLISIYVSVLLSQILSEVINAYVTKIKLSDSHRLPSRYLKQMSIHCRIYLYTLELLLFEMFQNFCLGFRIESRSNYDFRSISKF